LPAIQIPREKWAVEKTTRARTTPHTKQHQQQWALSTRSGSAFFALVK
jgi:hypothetical protein